jgi:hypothetical protein
MDFPKRYVPEPTSAPGDFYIVNGECISCGVPQHEAPDLVDWTADGSHCHWKKQPETPGELRRALAVFDAQCCGAHRYAGHDPDIQRRVGSEQCDYPLTVVQEVARGASNLYASWGRPVQHFVSDRTSWFDRLVAKLRRR